MRKTLIFRVYILEQMCLLQFNVNGLTKNIEMKKILKDILKELASRKKIATRYHKMAKDNSLKKSNFPI